MTLPGVSVLDAAYVLSVAAGAMIWPPSALLIAAAYFIASAIIADRRTPPKVGP